MPPALHTDELRAVRNAEIIQTWFWDMERGPPSDTIIAALRLWQRAPAYPEIEISEEHGEALGDTEIDTLIEEKLNGDAKMRNA